MKLKEIKIALENEALAEAKTEEVISKQSVEFMDSIDESDDIEEISELSDQTTQLLEETEELQKDNDVMSDYQENIEEIIESDDTEISDVVKDHALESIRSNIKAMCDRWGFSEPILMTSLATENLKEDSAQRLRIANESFASFINKVYEAVRKAIITAIKWFANLIGISGKAAEKKEERIKNEVEAIKAIDYKDPNTSTLPTLREKEEEKGFSFSNEGTIPAEPKTARIVHKDLITTKDLTDKATKLVKNSSEIIDTLADMLDKDLDATKQMSNLNKNESANNLIDTRLEYLETATERFTELYNKRLAKIEELIEKCDFSDSFKVEFTEDSRGLIDIKTSSSFDNVNPDAEVVVPRSESELQELIDCEKEIVRRVKDNTNKTIKIRATLEKFLKSYERSVRLKSTDQKANTEANKKIKEVLAIQRKAITTVILLIQFLTKTLLDYDTGISLVSKAALNLQKETGEQ